MISFLKTIIYIPLYNILVLVLDVLPVADIGIAIIILTLLVKLILYPVSKKASKAQFEMKKHEPELNLIKEKYKSNKEEQAVQIMAFYKKYGINPFSSLLPIFVQIPIIYSLYHIFLHSGLPVVNDSLLYSFISAPKVLSTNFLGFVDISSKNIFLAVLAALSTYIQIKNSPAGTGASHGKEAGFAGDLSKAMSSQMKYTFPIIVFFISWSVSGAVALYWVVSNLFSIVQDRLIRKQLN